MAPGPAGKQAEVLAADRAFLPRTIDFVVSSTPNGTSKPGAAGKNGDELPVPPHYLYPRDRLRELCEKSAPRRVGRGLINVGNTCFFNAVLQTLTHTRPLQNYLLSQEHSAACKIRSEGGFCALCLFERHAQEAFCQGHGPLNPKALLKHIKQIGGKAVQLGRQEDAHEFLRHFLEACHKASLRQAVRADGAPASVQRTTLFHQLFGGYLRSQVQCLQCNAKSNTFDPFMDLSLEVQKASTLEEALEAFTKSERLTGRNRYRCKGCQQLVDATKRFSIHSLPPLLTFQLKRFDFLLGMRGKIMKTIKFSTFVDLSKYTSRPKEAKATYRLYGVIVHSGNSAKSGHYYAFVRPPAGTWHQFDDQSVRPVPEARVLQQQAYLLFYELTELPREFNSRPIGEREEHSKAAKPGRDSANGGSNGSNGSRALASGSSAVPPAPPKEQTAAPSPAAPKPAAPAAPAPSGSAPTAAAVAPSAPPLRTAEPVAQVRLELGCQGMPRTEPDGDSSRRCMLLHQVSRLKRRRPRRVLRERSSSCVRAKRARAAAEGSSPEEVLAQELLAAPPPLQHVPEAPAEQTPEERASRSCDYKSQYGQAQVEPWEADVVVPLSESQLAAFEDVQAQLQPRPERRDELDADYDVGKRKHKPRTAKAAFAGKAAFDEVARTRTPAVGVRKKRRMG